MATQSLTDTFQSHAFLQGLGPRHLMRLAAGARPFTARPGEYLAREGAPADAFFLIQEGRVALETARRPGGAVTVQTVGPGEVVGWSWLVLPHRWRFDARAAEEVRGLSFNAEWLRDACESDHELGYQLLKHLLTVVAQRLTAARLAGPGARPD
jgi:CRP-like cAMP-binding protein